MNFRDVSIRYRVTAGANREGIIDGDGTKHCEDPGQVGKCRVRLVVQGNSGNGGRGGSSGSAILVNGCSRDAVSSPQISAIPQAINRNN